MGITIKQAATEVGIRSSAIRYYEKMKFLHRPQRSANGYRAYELEDIKNILFITHAKHIGFSLQEIKDLLSIKENSSSVCSLTKEKIEIKINEINTKIKNLRIIHKSLNNLLEECTRNKKSNYCPTIDLIQTDEGYEKQF